MDAFTPIIDSRKTLSAALTAQTQTICSSDRRLLEIRKRLSNALQSAGHVSSATLLECNLDAFDLKVREELVGAKAPNACEALAWLREASILANIGAQTIGAANLESAISRAEVYALRFAKEVGGQ